MDVGIGLPNAVAGTTGKQLVEFTRQAEKHGFSSLGTIDRTVYDNYDPFVALAAAAAVTERIRLTTASAATDAETVRQYVSGFEKPGCDELIFCPASGDPDQAGLLAEALEG